jgi:hypothetical protein
VITLSDEAYVPYPASAVVDFLTHMDRAAYLRWHPADHVDLVRRRRRVTFVEKIGTRTLKLPCVVKTTQRDLETTAEFVAVAPLGWLKAGRGSFAVSPISPTSCWVVATLDLGWRWRILDPIVRRIVDVNELERHMREEGIGFETALTDGRRPEAHRQRPDG